MIPDILRRSTRSVGGGGVCRPCCDGGCRARDVSAASTLALTRVARWRAAGRCRVRGGWGDTGTRVTVRTHCPDPSARGAGSGSGQAPSWHPELAAYRCFFRPDGVHRAPPHEDSHHRRHHPSRGADGDRPQACVQARITRISSAGHRERPP